MPRVSCFVNSFYSFEPPNLLYDVADHHSSRLLAVYCTNGETAAWSRTFGSASGGARRPLASSHAGLGLS